jgi:DNA (cytosine-5)-methyltransferase 1
VWPAATHGKGLKPYHTAADCIDWSIPCPSIFERERPLAEATQRRIAHGVMRYVVNAARPFIVPIQNYGWGDRPDPIDEPLRTVTAHPKGGAFALAVPTIAGLAHQGSDASRVHGVEKPISTIHAGGGNHALVAAFLAKHYGGNEGPGVPVDGPVSTITTQDHHHLVAAQLVGCGGRAGQSRPRDASEPVQTITAKGDTCLVTSHLAKIRGTSNSAATDEPLGTVSAQGTHHAEVRALLMKYYGTDQDPNLREPLHTITTKDRFGLVTVKGEVYAIADIGMRMLQPRELYRAQGFPDSYLIERGHDGRALSKADQVRMCGNSVCPPLARAIVTVNYRETDALRDAA